MQPNKQRILCIDNNASSNLAVYLLERVGYEVKMASSIADAEKITQVERFDLRLINHRLIDGLEIDSCERLGRFSPRITILFYSTVHTRTNQYIRFIADNTAIVWLRYMFMTSWALSHDCSRKRGVRLTDFDTMVRR